MTRIAHSNNIPISVEYLGLNEWAVRWDVQVDKDKETEDDIIHYKYNIQSKSRKIRRFSVLCNKTKFNRKSFVKLFFGFPILLSYGTINFCE